MTLRIAWGVAAHPDVAEFAICDRDARVVPDATAVAASRLGAWLANADDAVWFEPARHYWWKAALARQHTGARVPIVTMLHGLGYSRQVAPLLSSLAAPSAPGDVIIAPSEASATALRTQCANLIDVLGLNRQPPPITVIPYGVPPVVTTPREAARGVRLGRHAGRAVRRTAVHGGQGGLQRALRRRGAAANRRHRLSASCMAGTCTDGWLDTLRRHAQAHGIGDADMRPNVSTSRSTSLSAPATSSSPPRTPSPSRSALTLVEAMLHAAPVVATDWSGYREIVRDGMDGFLVPTAWRMDEAGGNSGGGGERQRQGRRQRQRQRNRGTWRSYSARTTASPNASPSTSPA